MPREVSRRTSRPPEQKARVSRPDIPGKRDLDPAIVRDVPDPVITGLVPARFVSKAFADLEDKVIRDANVMRARSTGYKDNNNGPEIQRGVDMDHYLKDLGPQVDEKGKK